MNTTSEQTKSPSFANFLKKDGTIDWTNPLAHIYDTVRHSTVMNSKMALISLILPSKRNPDELQEVSASLDAANLLMERFPEIDWGSMEVGQAYMAEGKGKNAAPASATTRRDLGKSLGEALARAFKEASKSEASPYAPSPFPTREPQKEQDPVPTGFLKETSDAGVETITRFGSTWTLVPEPVGFKEDCACEACSGYRKARAWFNAQADKAEEAASAERRFH